MKTFAALALMMAIAIAAPADNSKLLPLLGEWEGKANLVDDPSGASTMNVVRSVADRWIRVEMRFHIPDEIPMDLTAMLSSDAEGNVEGYFFASPSSKAVFGKGKVENKVLKITANEQSGDHKMEFVFDMSLADDLKVTFSELGSDRMRLTGSFTRKR